MKTWADHIYSFYKNLQPPQQLPNQIEWLQPYQNDEVLQVLEKFCHKFYNDVQPRTLLLGINPGRHGAGITGINFTAARQLSADCGISHPFKNTSELSAEFMYEMIEAYGGPTKFYGKFFMGAVCPLGFVQEGKNLNYYDDKELLQRVEPFITENLSNLISFSVNTQHCICIGGEKNFRVLNSLNQKEHWFQSIIPLPHPRFIMQYKRREKQKYIDMYLAALCAS
ncbi:MAG: uracil-DNA glycosylase family protein [Bacteroidota bacterium]